MATRGAKDVFIDTNVLVYAAVQAAPMHAAAREKLRSMQDEGRVLWISRQVIREYLAVLSRPQAFSKPVSMPVLADDVRRFERMFRVAGEDSAVTKALLDIVEQVPVAGRQVHDANIVATMIAQGIGRVLTNNTADFDRYAEWIEAVPL